MKFKVIDYKYLFEFIPYTYTLSKQSEAKRRKY